MNKIDYYPRGFIYKQSKGISDQVMSCFPEVKPLIFILGNVIRLNQSFLKDSNELY